MTNKEKDFLADSIEKAIPYAENDVINVSVCAAKEFLEVLRENDMITIEKLQALCGYGTHINIKLADNGQTVINGVTSMSYSKDKRQKAKWEAFKEMPVYCISPSVEIADVKRRLGNSFRMIIEASILRTYYNDAMSKYKELMNK